MSALRLMTFTLTAVVGLSACATELEDNRDPQWVDGKADSQNELFYRRIVSKLQFQSLALADGGVVIQGPSMKFLIDRRDSDKPRIYFQNANFKRNGKTPDSARFH